MIPVVIPAKNEEKFLKDTVESLREAANYAKEEVVIVVVDDGSTDRTADIALGLGCNVVSLEDRGYSALGLPELPNTHNAGFEYIEKNLSNFDFLMVVGADTSFNPNYLAILMREMHINEKLVMCAGVLNDIAGNSDAVRGSGRLIRRTFWSECGFRLRNVFYSWESYPLLFALERGFEVKTVQQARMQTPREPLAVVDWRRYGIGMKENGSLLIYVLLRGGKRLIKYGDAKGCMRLLLGFLWSKPVLYERRLRRYNARRQLKKLITFGILR